MACLNSDTVHTSPRGVLAGRFLDSFLGPFRGDARIRWKFSNRDAVLEKLVELLKRPALHLREEEIKECYLQPDSSAAVCSQLGSFGGLTERRKVRTRPYVSISRAPVQVLLVDKVRRSEGSEPCRSRKRGSDSDAIRCSVRGSVALAVPGMPLTGKDVIHARARADGQDAQARAHQLRGDRPTEGPRESIVECVVQQ